VQSCKCFSGRALKRLPRQIQAIDAAMNVSVDESGRNGAVTKTVIIRRKLFDGLSDTVFGPTEVLVEDGIIAEVSSSVGRPVGAKVP